MNTLTDLSLKTLAATMAVLAGNLVIGGVVHVIFGPMYENTAPLAELLLPMFGMSALMVIALIFPVRSSALSTGQLFAAVFLAILGINVILVQVEAVAFLEQTTPQILSAVIATSMAAAWLAFVMVKVFARPESGDHGNGAVFSRPGFGRLSLATICYVVLYLSAGMLIYPQVQDFYETQNINVGAWFIPLQIVRGALYVMFVLWLLQSMSAPRWQTGLALAIMFPILAGVAGLMLPNPILPADVRIWHIIEIGWSNFVYGGLVGWLFWRSPEIRDGSVELSAA